MHSENIYDVCTSRKFAASCLTCIQLKRFFRQTTSKQIISVLRSCNEGVSQTCPSDLIGRAVVKKFLSTRSRTLIQSAFFILARRLCVCIIHPPIHPAREIWPSSGWSEPRYRIFIVRGISSLLQRSSRLPSVISGRSRWI